MVATVDFLYPESPQGTQGQLLILFVAVLQGSLHTSPVKSFRHLLHNATSLLMDVLALRNDLVLQCPQSALSYTRKRKNISSVNRIVLTKSTGPLPIFPTVRVGL